MTETIDNYRVHFPVLLNEVVDYLSPEDNKSYLDCTFGAGGYTKAILESANCSVLGLDRDPSVKKFADSVQDKFGDRFKFIRSNFSNAMKKLDGKFFDGIVLDLGVSSMQIDEANRGFSFIKDGPLDMRMSSDGLSAEEFVNNSSEEHIADVIYKYGQEVQSRQIANKIVNARKIDPIKTTLQLANIVRTAMHFRKSKIDMATKTFQAIRIYVNKELESLESFLNQSRSILAPFGSIVVVSFHSLEDTIVKNFFKENSPSKVSISKYSSKTQCFEKNKWLKIITKKVIFPSKKEILLNPRSRSAKLRVARKYEV